MTRIDDAHHFSKRKIILNSFLGGLAWGTGSVIGATIIITILGFTLSRIDFIPMVADFIHEVNSYSEQQLSSPLNLPEDLKSN